jgi:multiple sugar transport system ATP-binding protein
MAELALEGIRKVYDNGVVALHDLNLRVADGELVVVVGPSGCGKSTVLRVIAGLETPDAGRVTIAGGDVTALPPRERDVAMVFQSYALYPHMSVRENLAFGLTVRKRPRAEIRERVAWAAELLGLDQVLDRKPRQLSGGQRQRVAIGRAIVRQPAVFLFDEPLSNLDAKLRVEMRREIAELQRELRATVVYVTHDQVEAMTMGDRIVVMQGGRVEQVAPPMELYAHPRSLFVARFIGTPPMNVLEGHLAAGPRFVSTHGGIHVELPPSLAPMLAPYASCSVIAGVRPEHLSLRPAGDAASRGCSLTGRVQLVEPLGNEVLLYALADGQEIVARLAPQPLPPPGADVSLTLDVAALRFFDPDTMQAIGNEAPDREGERRSPGQRAGLVP